MRNAYVNIRIYKKFSDNYFYVCITVNIFIILIIFQLPMFK